MAEAMQVDVTQGSLTTTTLWNVPLSPLSKKGDVVILTLLTHNHDSIIYPTGIQPSGWIQQAYAYNNADHHTFIWSKVLDGTETSSNTYVTFSTGAECGYILHTFRNVAIEKVSSVMASSMSYPGWVGSKPSSILLMVGTNHALASSITVNGDASFSRYSSVDMPNTSLSTFISKRTGVFTSSAVISVSGNGILAAFLLSEYAYFTPIDPALINSEDYQKKKNVDLVRSKVNEFRQINDIPLFVWTDPIVIEGITPIKAVHWNEIEFAILQVYTTKGQNLPDQLIKSQLEENIVPNDTRFIIPGLKTRVQGIIRALRNS